MDEASNAKNPAEVMRYRANKYSITKRLRKLKVINAKFELSVQLQQSELHIQLQPICLSVPASRNSSGFTGSTCSSC